MTPTMIQSTRATDGASPQRPTPGRARNMAAIKRTDTRPERVLRSILHRAGLRFRKDLRIQCSDRWVRPDIIFTRRRIAVFVDGCFWHSCPEHGRQPQVNTGYWSPKLSKNVARDRAADDALKQAGWTVVRVWEHEDPAQAAKRIVELVSSASARCQR